MMDNNSSVPPVLLSLAFAWRCPECRHDNFVRAVNANRAGASSIPESVVCSQCSQTFPTFAHRDTTPGSRPTDD